MLVEAAVLLGAAALLGGLVLALATGVRRVQRVSGWILAPAGLCGLAFYTLAYLADGQGAGGALNAVLRGVYSTCLMFMGRNEYASMVRLAPWFAESAGLQLLFWVAHLAALFVSAAALLSTLGKKLIQTLRLRVSRAKTVYLIYGLHEQSVLFGRELAAQKLGLVVYVEPNPAPQLQDQVTAFGGVVRQAPYLPGGAAGGYLMRLLGIRRGGRRAVVLALDASETANIRVAGALIDYFAAAGIPPRQVRVTLRSQGELDYSQLSRFEEKAGVIYDVDAFSDAELSARLLIHESAPYQTIRFDENGRAQEDFSALVIGFGEVGQHALRQVVMNGQFCGSRFSAVVVDRDASRISGQFIRRYAGMTEHYDIRFHGIDIRSNDFYALLDEVAPSLKYIVVCLGADDANYEATAALERYYARMDGARRPAIVVSVCNKRYVATARRNIRFCDRQRQVFSSRILLRDEVDQMAMAVNFSYSQHMATAGGVLEAWHATGYFSRESSRASADFIPAMLHMAGLNEAEARDEKAFAARVPQGGALLENLAFTEHLRWNAFHYAMGYTPMPLQEVAERGRQGVTPVQKDAGRLRHACLVSWDELDEVSRVVGGLTGSPGLDYKDLDRNNVRQIPRTLGIHRLLEQESRAESGDNLAGGPV